MDILLDILHPAHAHFFRHAIGELEGRGHTVTVTARDKDLTLALLQQFGVGCEILSREAESRAGLAGELLKRNHQLRRVVRRVRPQVMASIGGVSTAPVGFWTRTRNLVFYDTENARLSNLLSYPFASEVITPDCYRAKVMGRHATYPGYHELAYLHPSRFKPDPAVLQNAGIDPAEPYSVVRFVSWRAMHDVSATGFSADEKIRLVERLAEHGRVLISSEDELPESLAELRLPVRAADVHHVLAFARLFIGESATMASESAVLGTPAVYVDPVGRGYTDEQEARYGLCSNFRPWQAAEATERGVDILRTDEKHSLAFKESVARMLDDKIDVTRMIVDKLVGSS
jgi:predicted glycosyltransferase